MPPGGPEHPLLPGARLLRPLRLPGVRPDAGLPARVRPDPPGEAARLIRAARRVPAAAVPGAAPVCYQWFVAREQRGEQAPAPVPAGPATRRSYDLLRSLQVRADAGGSESLVTVLVAFGVNILIAVAKSAAAVVTGSASLLAEAAHSWADAGNEVFLLIANRRSRRPPDPKHPFGHGREAYVWSLLAAIGLFVAGAAISVTHGIQELITPEPATHFVVGYVVLALSFVLEGISLLRSVRQARPAAELFGRDVIE